MCKSSVLIKKSGIDRVSKLIYFMLPHKDFEVIFCKCEITEKRVTSLQKKNINYTYL